MREFIPKFELVESLERCAHAINLPHEDHPFRVPATISTMSVLLDICETLFSEMDAYGIHSAVMYDLPDQSQRGRWRTREVTVAGESTCPPYMIADSIKEHNIFPVTADRDLIEWYREFQIIHPFIDGNGRVGGIIVAVLHNIATDGEEWLAPLQ